MRDFFKKNARLFALGLFLVVFITILIVNFATEDNFFVGKFWALVPPFVAIALALITKEVYSSLFGGVLLGALMASNCSFTGTVNNLVVDGLSTAVADNAGILVFLVLLGIVVALVNKAGASRAFGKWAEKRIHTKVGAALATFLLGMLIFIDDYFNCLTVGNVMAPVTDRNKISRVKLAYIIDATAAPVCMIAPISSWAAAVSGVFADAEFETSISSIGLFLRAIPFNFYSLFTLVFIIAISLMGFDYGKMSSYEILASTGDLSRLDKEEDDRPNNDYDGSKIAQKSSSIWDLIVPVALLIVACVAGLLYVGYESIDWTGTLAEAFGSTDAYVGLPWGGIIALVVIVGYFLVRRVMNFEEAMGCVKQGFVAMVPAITILTLATSLKNVTGALDASAFVKGAMANAGGIEWLLPALVFIVACVIAFATGTSWGTFGILIPIVLNVFSESSPLFFVGISACLAGAVCGDHCSPISDTTIMSSAGAQCDHISHVETQMPYAITVAALSFVSYLIAGLLSLANLAILSLPIGAVLTVATLFVIKKKGLFGAVTH